MITGFGPFLQRIFQLLEEKEFEYYKHLVEHCAGFIGPGIDIYRFDSNDEKRRLKRNDWRPSHLFIQGEAGFRGEIE